VTDTLEASARCLACDTRVHGACIGGRLVFLECVPSGDGDHALFAGDLMRVVPRGEPVPAKRYVVHEEYLRGAMRFWDHQKKCTKTRHVETSMKKTRPTGVWNRDR
jgi:hypothetical protein